MSKQCSFLLFFFFPAVWFVSKWEIFTVLPFFMEIFILELFFYCFSFRHIINNGIVTPTIEIKKPSILWFKNAESRLNHNLLGLFKGNFLILTGHLVQIIIPGSWRKYVGWNNFLDVLAHPQALDPLFTG